MVKKLQPFKKYSGLADLMSNQLLPSKKYLISDIDRYNGLAELIKLRPN